MVLLRGVVPRTTFAGASSRWSPLCWCCRTWALGLILALPSP